VFQEVRSEYESIKRQYDTKLREHEATLVVMDDIKKRFHEFEQEFSQVCLAEFNRPVGLLFDCLESPSAAGCATAVGSLG